MDLNERSSTHGETLRPAERARAARFASESLRERWTAARGALRAILGWHLGLDPKEVELERDPLGKPRLSGRHRDGTLQFNLSHSDQIAVVVVARFGAVGIDVEQVVPLPDADQVVARYFSRAECAFIDGSIPRDRVAAFFQVWTCKEALVKAVGLGVDRIGEVRLDMGDLRQPRVLALPGDSHTAAEWTIATFAPAADYVAAVAVPSDTVEVRVGWWDAADRPAGHRRPRPTAVLRLQ